MPTCPRCQQLISGEAIVCPQCRLALKAHGHPGIPLYRAIDKETLCQSCLYHADDTCNFPQRPHAQECTLYQSIEPSRQETPYRLSWQSAVRGWLQRYGVWLALLGLVVVSLVIALGG